MFLLLLLGQVDSVDFEAGLPGLLVIDVRLHRQFPILIPHEQKRFVGLISQVGETTSCINVIDVCINVTDGNMYRGGEGLKIVIIFKHFWEK